MKKRINKVKEDVYILNKLRKIMGVKQLKIKIKKCCKCSIKFETTTSDICCPNCRLVNSKYFDFYSLYNEVRK